MENNNIINLEPGVYEFLKKNLPLICDTTDLISFFKISQRSVNRIFNCLKKQGKLIKECNRPQAYREDIIELLDNIQEEPLTQYLLGINATL